MLGHKTMLGVTTLAAVITVVTCGFCNVVSVGSTDGEEITRTAVVPVDVKKYDIKVQPLCREDDIVGLKASGCNEYNWNLSIANKFIVHVDRDESPDEIFVKLAVYCNFSYSVEETEGIEYSKAKIDFNNNVDKKYNDTSENIKTGNVLVAVENNVEQTVVFEQKDSTNTEKETTNEDLKNKTSEDKISDNIDSTAAPKQKPQKEKSKAKKIEKKTKKDAEKFTKKWMKKMQI